MEAKKASIADIFNGHRIFKVPFYQRSYVWQEDEWTRFLEDMEFVSVQNKEYFLGSTIVKQQNTSMDEVNDLRIIVDGQQRFTTLAIFAKVLCLKNVDEQSEFDSHFMTKKRDKSKTYAIIHSCYDNAAFCQVMSQTEDKPMVNGTNNKIIDAYNFFQSHVDHTKVDIDAFFSRLIFISIELQQDEDEQLIFDTINSLGVRLTTAELLKNYFFADNSKKKYENIWFPLFERDAETIEYWNTPVTAGRKIRSNIDAFFSSYLNIKIQDKSLSVDNRHRTIYRRADSMFKSYKDLINTYKLNKDEILSDIIAYAKLYSENIKPDVMEADLPGEPCIERINFLIYALDCSTMLPYILYVLKEVKEIEERNRIFGYLESYIVRRAICQSANNSFSDLFAEILLGNEVKSFEGLRDIIESKTEEKLSFPTDEEVITCLKEKKQPNKRAMAILYLIESRLRNDQKHATKLHPFKDYELEHLMPKKFEKNWPLPEDYDEDQRRRLIETLGNMSLLPSKLNRSVSNADWETKKNGKNPDKGLIFYASDLVTLKNVIQSPVWNENEIKNRAQWIADVIIEKWPSYIVENEDFEDDVEIDTSCYTAGGTNGKQGHNCTKYSFNQIEYMSKSSIVLHIVKKYMELHPTVTYAELKNLFSDDLCPSGYKFIGFLVTKDEYDKWNNNYKEKRYLPNRQYGTLHSYDGVDFYVNTQWSQSGEFRRVLKLAENEGIKVYER